MKIWWYLQLGGQMEQIKSELAKKELNEFLFVSRAVTIFLCTVTD